MGGLPLNRTRIAAFKNCMDKCGLMDLGFQGPRFTWTNKSSVWNGPIQERLDQGLGNAEWKMLFPTAEIDHLPRVKSDHCPIMLLTDPLEQKSPKPFRFEQMWLTDPPFPSIVDEGWKASEAMPSASSSLSRFPHRLKFLIAQIHTWNKSHFRNLFQRKNCLLARLQGLQIALPTKPSAFLYSLEHQLTQEYNSILHQEYLYWQFKSWVTWLNYGDANTKFFHLITLHRRSQSWVVTLKDTTRLWLTGELLLAHVNDAFKKLFQATSEYRRSSHCSEPHVCLSSPDVVQHPPSWRDL